MTVSMNANVPSAFRPSIAGNAASQAGLIAIRSLASTSATSGGRSLDILAILNGSPELREAFNGQFARISKDENYTGISKQNAGHLALFETIMANRSEFPAGEFTIHTDLGDGASITTTIPAMGSSASRDYLAPTLDEARQETAVASSISRNAVDVGIRYRSY